MKRSIMAVPYIVFLILFVVLPLVVIFSYAFTGSDGEPTFNNFIRFFSSSRMLGTLLYSLFIGVVTTAICLAIAYPTAYILAKGEYCRKHAFLMLFVVPMWINFTLRITALKEILTLIEGNIAYYPTVNTIICMVYDFLPFMILPIFNSITRLENRYMEAAADLGAKPWQVMMKVVIPLSLPGIISGITMVFLPSMTNYVVLDMVYNSTYIMGSLIGSFFSSYDWHGGAFVSVVLLVLIGLITILLNRVEGVNVGERR